MPPLNVARSSLAATVGHDGRIYAIGGITDLGKSDVVESYEADRADEVVYGNQIVDPGGADASITIAHTFYGVFEVVSFLTRRPPSVPLAS